MGMSAIRELALIVDKDALVKKRSLSLNECALLGYTIDKNVDLSRDAIASVLKVVPTSVGRILTKMQNRGLIRIHRGQHRKILKIEHVNEN